MSPLTPNDVREIYGDNVFQRILLEQNVSIADGDSDYNTEAEITALIQKSAKKVPVVIWEMSVLSQQLIAWGAGSELNPLSVKYPQFVCINKHASLGGFLDGYLTLSVRSRSAFINTPAKRIDTRGIRQHPSTLPVAASRAAAFFETDRAKLRSPLGLTAVWAQEGDVIQMQLQTIAVPGATAGLDLSFVMPISIIELG